ncbi:hypothetical protein TEK04_05075 [Klenkia sp. LSe6-5]|uniref:Tetratricopeptide repeat-containing protein n=1 Tax=Klenkia sesuvii TaxID=3103137 RepID=A0ABU8DQG8_9ACTN
MRRALRGLESRNATVVGQHLAAAGGLVDEDPQAALAHAQAARERASRIAVVREAVGVAAYHAGEFAEAARELRAYRRMSGDESYRAVLADCERALGRPDVALRLVAEALAQEPPHDEVVELRLVEAGARQDMGEVAAAALVLEAALGGRPEPAQLQAGDLGQLRLATAYGDLLEARGEEQQAQAWFEAVMAADPADETGVAARFDAVEFDELDDVDEFDGVDDVDEDSDSSDDDDPADGVAVDGEGRADGVEPGGEAGVGVASGGGAEDELPGTDVPVEYDPDEQDLEEEVAELLGEIPVPGFSDTQVEQPVIRTQPRPIPADSTGLFSAPEDGSPGEHTPPTN